MVKMQVENDKNIIKTLSFGCRLNALDCEKIKNMLLPHGSCAVVVNTCSVTAEAERQCGQTVRKIVRENPNALIFVTGCGATRNPTLFQNIKGVIVIPNSDKMKLESYMGAIKNAKTACELNVKNADSGISKQFIQIQNGCNHDCTYCITRLLRGKSVSFEYDDILRDLESAINRFNRG